MLGPIAVCYSNCMATNTDLQRESMKTTLLLSDAQAAKRSQVDLHRQILWEAAGLTPAQAARHSYADLIRGV